MGRALPCEREAGRGCDGRRLPRQGQGGQPIALKILKGTTPRQLERFRREQSLTTSLDHPNVVGVHDVGDVGGVPYVAYELIPDARPLGEVLRTAVLREQIELLRDVARGLGHAHDRGVVHRDVKPDNALVDRSGVVRVTDFGLAATSGEERLTVTGQMLGTPHYMAPEIMTGDHEARRSPQIDVWSLGVMLYEVLTDEPPFDAIGVAGLLDQIREGPIVPPGKLNPEAPPLLEQICLHALARDRRERSWDANEVADALDEWLEGGRPTGWSGARLGVLGLVGLVGAVGLGVALASLLPSEPDSPLEAPSAAPGHSPSVRPTPGDPLLVKARLGGPAEATAWGEALLERGAPVEAASWLARAASGGDAKAQALLADLYLAGRGLEKDEGRALELYRSAAQRGHARSMVFLGDAYRGGLHGFAKELKVARGWYEFAAERDDPEGMNQLGFLLQRGAGGPADRPRAVQLWERAAAKGHPMAMAALAFSYMKGVGVRQDPVRGADWYQRSAEAGSPEGMVGYAYAFQVGQGRKKDFPTAARWYRKSAETGNGQGMARYSQVLYDGLGVKRDVVAAAEWAKRSAEKGNTIGMNRWAYALRSGEGVERDYVQARVWLERAETLREPQSILDLAVLYDNGHGVPRDPVMAKRKLEAAVRLNHAPAMVALAQVLREGRPGVPRDPAGARRLLVRAANMGYPEATRLLRELR